MQTESMGGVLSFMFGAWALSNWALAFELWSWKLEPGRFLCFLMASGVGEAMASVFDINHQCTILPSQSVSKCR